MFPKGRQLRRNNYIFMALCAAIREFGIAALFISTGSDRVRLYHPSFMDISHPALLLREYELLEEAYRIRTYRHRAFYSLDYAGGIERDMASLDQKSPYDIVEKRYDAEQIYKGLAALPEKQRNRIYAHYFLGMSKNSIARAEKVNESNVRQSIEHGLRNLEKFLRKNF